VPSNPSGLFIGFVEFIVFVELLSANSVQLSTGPCFINPMNTVSLEPYLWINVIGGDPKKLEAISKIRIWFKVKAGSSFNPQEYYGILRT
jgi:hypothetical protein